MSNNNSSNTSTNSTTAYQARCLSLMQQIVAGYTRKERDGVNASLERKVNDSMTFIKKEIDKSTPAKATVTDSYGNLLTATGTKDVVKNFDSYGWSNSTLNYPLWLALYNDSWIFKKLIDKPAQDMVRSGIDLVGKSDKQLDVLKKYRTHEKGLIKLIKWGRLFGGSIAVMLFDNIKSKDMEKKLDANKVKQSKTCRLYVVDRWYGVQCSSEIVDDLNDADYGTPMYYTVTMANGSSQKIHHSYILRYAHRDAPPLIQKGQLQGWGYCEGAHILHEIMRNDKLKDSIQSLIDKSLIEVIKMPGMRGVFMGANKQNQEQLEKRLEMVNWARTFNSLTFLDKEDEYSQNSYGGLSGLADLLDLNMWEVAASVDMTGVLYGDRKGGLGNDATALQRYDDNIQDLNKDFFNEPLTKLLKVLYIQCQNDDDVDFTFKSLLVKQQDKEKMQGIKEFQSLLSSTLADGVITLKQYAKSLKDYTDKGVINFHMDDDYIDSLDDKMKEQMEDIVIPDDDDDDIKLK